MGTIISSMYQWQNIHGVELINICFSEIGVLERGWIGKPCLEAASKSKNKNCMPTWIWGISDLFSHWRNIQIMTAIKILTNFQNLNQKTQCYIVIFLILNIYSNSCLSWATYSNLYWSWLLIFFPNQI